MPARLHGVKEDTGAHIEVLLLKQEEGDKWETLVKPAKRVKEGTVISFGEGKLKATCTGTADQGGRQLEFSYDGIFYEILDELGEMPLPPYIKETLEDAIAIKQYMRKKSVQRRRRLRDFTLQKSYLRS